MLTIVSTSGGETLCGQCSTKIVSSANLINSVFSCISAFSAKEGTLNLCKETPSGTFWGCDNSKPANKKHNEELFTQTQLTDKITKILK